jgi:hypothetical protein
MRKLLLAAALLCSSYALPAHAVTDENFLNHYNITAADLNNRQGFEKIYQAIKAEIGGGAPAVQCRSGECFKVWTGRGVSFAEETANPQSHYWCAISEKTTMCISQSGSILQSYYDPASQRWSEGVFTRTRWP